MSAGPRAVGTARPPADGADEVHLQGAKARHALQISALYRQAYAGGDPADPAACYPFPQLMEPSWVAEALSRRTLRWFVAVADGQVVGTIGATPNVGAPADGVAEYFGLVVDERWRSRGIARSLFQRLYQSLVETSHFMIAETRTAHPGGWRTVRSFDFVPLGFEPFAHHTPAGTESMIVLGHVSGPARQLRGAGGGCSTAVRALAEIVLGQCGLPAPSCAKPRFARATTAASPRVERDDMLGRELFASRSREGFHGSGVVGLRRLEGIDPAGRRYTDAYFVDRAATGAVARVLWDHLDRRARVLFLHTPGEGRQAAMVEQIVTTLEAHPQGGPQSLVVEVRADQAALQAGLEALGFFPTVYYPGLLGAGARRLDAVQFTRLSSGSLDEATVAATSALWPDGGDVARRVVALSEAAAGTRA